MESLRLRNGKDMPIVGFGLAIKGNSNSSESIANPNVEKCVEQALQAGYKHFDTAYLYNTEPQLGLVLNKWISKGQIQRDDLFVVSKLPCIGMSPDKVHHFIKLSLNQLQLTYIDLYLVHWPIGLLYVNDTDLVPKNEHGEIMYDKSTNLEAVWKQMEAAMDLGLVKAIGISNFSTSQIERICQSARILPSVLQIEMNLYIQQKDLCKVCSKYGIQMTAFAPLGSPGRILRSVNNNIYTISSQQPLNDPAVLEIAKHHFKTPAQILLRFLMQQNVSVIPKTVNPERMVENLDVFNFTLCPEELEMLKRLDKGSLGRVFDFFPGGKNHPEYPF